jgi:Tfp pilus assembly protein PilE
MDRQLQQGRAGERGITLVELVLVVMLVAVLVAVALPQFLSQRTKAQDAEAKAVAVTVAGTLLVWENEHGTFAGADVDRLAAIEPTIGRADGLTVDVTPETFRVRKQSAAGSAGGGPFTIEYDSSGVLRSCATPNRGGCPDDSRW